MNRIRNFVKRFRRGTNECGCQFHAVTGKQQSWCMIHIYEMFGIGTHRDDDD